MTTTHEDLRPMDPHVQLGDRVRVMWSEGRHCWAIVKGDAIMGDAIAVLLSDVLFDAATTGAMWVHGTLDGWASHPMGRSCYPGLHGNYRNLSAAPFKADVVELLPNGQVIAETT